MKILHSSPASYACCFTPSVSELRTCLRNKGNLSATLVTRCCWSSLNKFSCQCHFLLHWSAVNSSFTANNKVGYEATVTFLISQLWRAISSLTIYSCICGQIFSSVTFRIHACEIDETSYYLLNLHRFILPKQ